MAAEATMMFTPKQYERWTEEDDDLLRTMLAAGKSITLLTVKLKRPIAALRRGRRTCM